MAARRPDPYAAIVDEQTFLLLTELEVRKAVRLQYYVSLLGIQAEVEGPTRPADVHLISVQVAQVISQGIRSTDVIGVKPVWPNVHILLVSAHLYNLPTIIGRLIRVVNRHTFEVGERPQPVSLAIAGACFPTTARGGEDLFAQVAALIAEAQRDRAKGHRYRLASTVL